MHIVPVVAMDEPVFRLGVDYESLMESLVDIMSEGIETHKEETSRQRFLDALMADTRREFLQRHPALSVQYVCIPPNQILDASFDLKEADSLMTQALYGEDYLVTLFKVSATTAVSEYFATVHNSPHFH